MNDLIYQVTMSFVRQMLEKGLITDDEYREFDEKMIMKYSPQIGLLVADIDLINCGLYGNMYTRKEGGNG